MLPYKPQTYNEFKFYSHGITGIGKTLCGTGIQYEYRMEGTLDVPQIDIKFSGSRESRHPWSIETNFNLAVQDYIKYRKFIITKGQSLRWRTNDMVSTLKISTNEIYKSQYDNFILSRQKYNTNKAYYKTEIKNIKADMVLASRNLNEFLTPYKLHEKFSEGIIEVFLCEIKKNLNLTNMEQYEKFHSLSMEYYRLLTPISYLSTEINKYKNKLIDNEYEYQLARIKLYEISLIKGK